ncbi:MAG: SPW repeat protein [Candidatus Moranbacteria bacterium]|nr:SPW repeat protein [Candidatus Moranbacteria bacterium]
MNGEQNIKTVNWLIVIAGLWLIIAPFTLGFGGTMLSMNDVITGIIIAIISLIAIGLPEESRWLNWVSAILGIWIFITPFFLASIGRVGMWNNLIIGVITVVLGIWGTMSISSPSSSSSQMSKAV